MFAGNLSVTSNLVTISTEKSKRKSIRFEGSIWQTAEFDSYDYVEHHHHHIDDHRDKHQSWDLQSTLSTISSEDVSSEELSDGESEALTFDETASEAEHCESFHLDDNASHHNWEEQESVGDIPTATTNRDRDTGLPEEIPGEGHNLREEVVEPEMMHRESRSYEKRREKREQKPVITVTPASKNEIRKSLEITLDRSFETVWQTIQRVFPNEENGDADIEYLKSIYPDRRDQIAFLDWLKDTQIPKVVSISKKPKSTCKADSEPQPVPQPQSQPTSPPSPVEVNTKPVMPEAPMLMAIEFVHRFDTISFNNKSSSDSLAELIRCMERNPRVCIPVGYDGNILYRLFPKHNGLRAHSDPTESPEVLSISFLGVNTAVQPKYPSIPHECRRPDLPETSTTSSGTDLNAPGFVSFQLGQLEYARRPDPNSEGWPKAGEENAAELVWEETGFCLVARLGPSGRTHGVYAVYDMFPPDRTTHVRPAEPVKHRLWGLLPVPGQAGKSTVGEKVERFSCARLASRTGVLGTHHRFKWTEVIGHPVELVRVVKGVDGRPVRASV